MKKIVAFLPVAVLVFILLSMRPVPDPNENNTEKVAGTVSEIYQAGSNDIVFRLMNDEHFYYINKNVKQQVSYVQLKKDLLYKDVEISFVKHWSLLNASGSARSMCELTIGDQVFFSALD